MISAISATLNSLTGSSIGEKNPKKIKRFLVSALMLTTVFICLVLLILVFLQDYLINFYTTDPQIISILKQLIEYYYIILVADYIQIQLGSYIRSIGKENLGFWGFIVCFYVIALPLCYFLGTILDMNVIGLRIGMLVGIYCLCVFDLIVIWKTDLNKQIIFINSEE